MTSLSAKKINGNSGWITVFVAIIAANCIAAVFHERVDLTNEKRFTISAPVKKLLGNMDSVAEVDIFLAGDLPAGFKNLATSASELLQEFKEFAGGKINYKIISADETMAASNRT